MDFFELIRDRRSIRKFTDKEVEPEKIYMILEAVRIAPSSSNSQPWYVIVVRDKKQIAALSKSAMPGSRFVISWMAGAPLVFVLCVRRKFTHKFSSSFGHQNVWLDAGIAGQHLVLAAHALGLGTCWIGWFTEKKIRELIELPVKYHVAALIPCGYPAETPKARPRKSLEDVYSLETFSDSNKKI